MFLRYLKTTAGTRWLKNHHHPTFTPCLGNGHKPKTRDLILSTSQKRLVKNQTSTCDFFFKLCDPFVLLSRPAVSISFTQRVVVGSNYYWDKLLEVSLLTNLTNRNGLFGFLWGTDHSFPYIFSLTSFDCGLKFKSRVDLNHDYTYYLTKYLKIISRNFIKARPEHRLISNVSVTQPLEVKNNC